ncbi:MAG TPA: D-alanyl-D-alanine carboxypeptidase family protein [Vitreimonas sp.]|uniref:D-alanyl-D-alanine carboxypeptidase family protein n=1 Tax=Vitreimonas sp. TaxID=3069702 RepID=UPI002D3E933B|nr:D-alanyl-D-alanine carboxypeptidase family protein [Vitreimonas sp.]HYD87449.1 D-alanyl-D-alanine carboxypeptidase family protein [Vitreimonas sp.]
MRLAALSLAAALAAAPMANAQTGAFTTTAQHVTIMDGASGAILYCNDCQTPMPPASMSKIMTVLLVAEAIEAGRITWDTRYPVSEYAWRNGAMSDGSHMFLPLNATATVRDLLRGAIVVSANDACIVLAEGLFGSEEAFVAEMNRRAQALGLRSARFRNSTGLPDPDHVISSADLARLARHLIVTYPEIYRIYSEREFRFNNRTQQNRNPLLGAFAGADGVKTGHTDASGYGLVGSAVLNDQRRIIVFNGMRSMADRREEGVRLMRAAFHDFTIDRVAAAGEQVGEAQVRLGSRRTVPLVAQRDIVIGGPRGVQTGLTAHIVYNGPLRPPLREGDVVARLVVSGPGFQTQEFPLAAGRRVGRANWFSRAFEGLRLTLFGP